MTHEDVHELAAAYALDALDDDERAAFEQHLPGCARCQEAVRTFRETAALLAYATEGPDPPSALRERVLEEAGRERPQPSVVVLRPRRALAITAVAAAAAVAAAVGLGVWAASLSNSLDAERKAASESARIAAILTDAGSTRLPLGGAGEVVRGEDGAAVLVMRDLAAAPPGQDYEAWVIAEGVPARAGLFEGGGQEIVLLERSVPKGAIVAVTLEPDGGLDQPTGDVLFGSEEA